MRHGGARAAAIDGHRHRGLGGGRTIPRTGQKIGAGGETFDLALDPLEGRGSSPRGGAAPRQWSRQAIRGRCRRFPDMYMRKMAVGPTPRGKIDLKRPVADNIEAIAEAFGRRVGDITTIVLDRPRHHDLIEEIRQAGARIKLIQDGDVTASISAAIRGTNDHLAIGISGTRRAVHDSRRSALGGEMQAQLWPTTRRDRARHRARDRGHRAHLVDRRPRADRGDRRGDRRLEAISCAECVTWPTARGRTRSSCARAATGCASWTAFISSPASAAKRFGFYSLIGVPAKEEVTEAMKAGRGSRARDGHRRPGLLRRRGRRAE